MTLTKLDLFMLSFNFFALGGLVVLIALRGATGPSVLLAVGAALVVIARLGKAFTSTPT